MSAALALDKPFPTDLLFDPDVVDGRQLIRISEVTDSSVTDLDLLNEQREFLSSLPTYEFWLDAFGPNTEFKLRIYDDAGAYDLLLSRVQLGELRDTTLTLKFRRKSDRWSVAMTVGGLGVDLGPADFRSFRDGIESLNGTAKLKAARQAFHEIFDGHVRAASAIVIRLDRNLVWRTLEKSAFTAFDGVAKFSHLEFKWVKADNLAPQFVAEAPAQSGEIALGGGTLGPCLELKPGLRGDGSVAPVTFSAGDTRKGDNPRLEVRLTCTCWSTVITENGPILGPLFTNGLVSRQRDFTGPYKPGQGTVISTVAAGIVHNASTTIKPVEVDPDCPPKGVAATEASAELGKDRYASFPSAIGTIEALSAETEAEADKAIENGAERPFWAYAVANAKGKLVIEETNVSLLLRRLGTALPQATVSSLAFTDAAFQLLYRRTGNLQLPASYFWLGARCLIENTPRSRIDLTHARLRASRSTDLISLGFRFSDLCLVYDWLANKHTPEQIDGSIRIEPLPDYCRAIRREGEVGYEDTRPLLVVEFPRQHVMEEALFRQELPPMPSRRIEIKPGDHELFPPKDEAHPDAPRWFKDPRRLIDQIASQPLEERARIRQAWFYNTTPADKDAAEIEFCRFRKAFAAAARLKPPGDAHTKPLPLDQQFYVGPYGLDADAMAIGRRILEKKRAAYAESLVTQMFAEVSAQADLIGKDKTPPKTLEAALAFEHLLETSVPSYQLFRDHYRQLMIDARLGEPTIPELKAPDDLEAGQIEFFAVPNRGFLPPAVRGDLEARSDLVIPDYKTALTANSRDIPEVLRGRLSEPSRLAFRVNCGPDSGTMGRLPEARGRDFIAFTLDGLTDWSRHELSVVRRSQRLIDPERNALLPPADRRHANIDDTDILAFQGFKPGPFVTPQQRLGEIAASLQHAPTPWETSIELPARLILSTAQDAVWRTPRYFGPEVFWRKYGASQDPAPALASDESSRRAGSMPPEGRPATLWYASIDPDADDPGLRVVHSPDFRPEFFWSRNQRLESRMLFEGGNIRLPGNGAPPRGPFAPWLIGREQLDTPAPSWEALEKAYEDANPDLKNETEDDKQRDKTFIEACPLPKEKPKKFWLSLSKYLFNRETLLKRYGKALEFRTSLDAYDRHELVILSSAYGLPVLGRRAANGKLLDDSSQFEPQPGFRLEGIAPGSAIYQPRTLNLRELTLTAIGGTLRHDTSFLPPASAQTIKNDNLFDALSIERWQHWAVLGRDVFTEVVYKGFLFPLGQRASLVKLTERVFMRASGTDRDGVPNGAVKAYLRQRMFIRVGKPDKEYPAIGQANGGRQFPVGVARILTVKTPDIVDPTSIATVQTGAMERPLPSGRLPLSESPGLAFWPRTAMTPDADILFDVTLDGRLTRLPLIFIDNTAAHDPGSLARIVEYYNTRILSPDANLLDPGKAGQDPDAIRQLTHKRTVKLSGQGIRYCDERKEGDSTHETIAWTFKAQGRRSSPQDNDEGINEKFNFDPVMEGAEQPPFYPALETARILLRQTERFSGRPATPSVVQFDGHYIANGFALEQGARAVKGNAAEIYLNLVRPMPMTIGNNGDRSGGMFRPKSDFVAVSRIKGPIGGSPDGRPDDKLDQDLPVARPGALVSRAESYDVSPDANPADAKAKLLQVYKRYFALDTKLLGMIRLNKLLEYMDLLPPETGMPLLKEALDYGIAQASGALEEVDQASNAGRTAVQGEVIAPLLKVVQRIRADWDKAQAEIAAAQSGTPGKSVTLDTLFPEIGQGLRTLEQALMASMGTTGLVAFFASLADIHEAGRQLIAGLKRAGSNAAARVDAAIREKIGALTEKITSVLGEAAGFLRAAASRLLVSAANLLVDALIPPGHHDDNAVAFASFLPPEPQGLLHDNDVEKAWKKLFIVNGEARAFLLAIVLNDEAGRKAFAQMLRDRFKAAEDALPPDHVLSFGWYAYCRSLLHPHFLALDKLAANPLDKLVLDAALPPAVLDEVNFIQTVQGQIAALKHGLDDNKPSDVAKAAAAILGSLAGPLGLYDKLEETKQSVNTVLDAVVAGARKAVEATTLCKTNVPGNDDLCTRLDRLSGSLDQLSGKLLVRIDGKGNDDIPQNGDLKELHDLIKPLSEELTNTRAAVDNLRNSLIADTATTRAFLGKLPAGTDYFKDDDLTRLLGDFRQLAEAKSKLAQTLANGIVGLTTHAREIARQVKHAIGVIDAAVAEAEPPLNRLKTLEAAIGSFLVTPAQAALSPGDQNIANQVKQQLNDLQRDLAQACAEAFEYALQGLHDASSAASDGVGSGSGAVDKALVALDAELTKVVSAVSPGTELPLQTTVRQMRDTIKTMAKDLDTVLDVVVINPNVPGDSVIDTSITTFDDLFTQVNWCSKAVKTKFGDVLDRQVPALRDNTALLEKQVAQLAQQSGRALVGLGKDFIEQRLPPVIDRLLNGFDFGGRHFGGLDKIYQALATARSDALAELNAAGLPQIVKQGVRDAMTALPLTGADDRLVTESKMLTELALAARERPSKVISDPATRARLNAFVAGWEKGSASPLVIARQVEESLQDLLRGEWFKLIDVSGIRNEVERYIKQLVPVRARLAYSFGAEMTSTVKAATAGIFVPEDGSRLDIDVAASVDFIRPQEVKFSARGTLGPFAIKLVGDLVDAVTINFHGANFTLSGGSGPQLSVMYDDFVIGPALEYVQRLQKMMSPTDGSGFYLLPRLQPLGIEAGYGLGLPIITLGNVSFSNISLNAAVVIPFDGSDARFRASLSRRDAPFTIAVAPYGGSGFFAIEANAEGIVGFEASFEFGGAAAFQFGPLSGIGRLMLGVYIKQTLVEIAATDTAPATKRRSTEITATFYVGGSASIWIFTFGASLYVRLGMKDGNMTGVAIFTFSFSLGIVDYDYSVSVERTENKLGNGQQSSAANVTRLAALGNDLFTQRLTTRNEFDSWITNSTKCQGVDWPTYRSYFDRSITPPSDDLFEGAA